MLLNVLFQALKTDHLREKKICPTVRIYEKSTLGYPNTCKTQTRTTAGTQENITWGKHVIQSELKPIPFLTCRKNIKSSTAVVKEKHKLQFTKYNGPTNALVYDKTLI
jgi:hypothetical protein